MPQYRRGFGRTIAPTVYAEIVENPNDDLVLKRAGTAGLTLGNGQTISETNLIIPYGQAVYNDSWVPLMGFDANGKLTQLTTIKTKLEWETDELLATLLPATCLYSGAAVGTIGKVVSSSSETVKFGIPAQIPTLFFGYNVRLDKVTVYYETKHDDDYITTTRLMAMDQTGSSYTLVTDNDDKQNGSSSASSFDVDPSTNPVANNLSLEFDTVVPLVGIEFYRFVLYYTYDST